MDKTETSTSRVRKLIRQSLFPESLRHKLEDVASDKGKYLYDRYIELINDYRLGMFDKLGVDAGKFVEEFIKIVSSIEGVPVESSKVKTTIDKINSTLSHKGKGNKGKEKKIMLEVAYYSIYTLRNSRDAAHANQTPISQWDARHIIETATWLLEEFLRIYGNLSEEVIENIFSPFSISTYILRVVENIDDKLVPLVDELKIKDLILLTLMSSKNSCLSPKDIINTIPEAKPGTIYRELRELAKENLIIKVGGRKGCYEITSKGRKFIHDTIKKLITL
ncbi:MAG: hypothetical protein GSR84_02740 [Desulfurococcales archaeon]|nr:hypothetical protein [Desulfurococcales archaeon]